MKLSRLSRTSLVEWRIPQHGPMRVPGVLYGTEALLRAMDDKVYDQVIGVATLPGIVGASYAMPDAHWGYGFPIGGVAAFDAEAGGIVSAGGVGFDISCGVRTLTTGLTADELWPHREALAEALFRRIPAGVGSTGTFHLDADAMDEMLTGGARWAVGRGFGAAADLDRIEEHGCMPGADPSSVSAHAKRRQQDEMGTLGSGNHYLEVQRVVAVFDETAAERWGLRQNEVVISLHCGSRGLGHQIGTEYLKLMVKAAPGFGITLPDRELACAPVHSALGGAYLGAMRAGINCAFANRQVLTHLVREVMASFFPASALPLLYDVSHNTCKAEQHVVDGEPRVLYVHRKGATRAFGPSHPDVPPPFKDVGQPVLIGGTMGTASYVLAGADAGEARSWSSSCHGAGRAMSRHQALREFSGRSVVDTLAARGVLVKSPSLRGVAEEAPGAYKDVAEVVDAADTSGLSRKVARLEPMICIKG